MISSTADIDLSQTSDDGLAFEKSIAIAIQQLTVSCGIMAIGLATFPVFSPNEDRLVRAVISLDADQPAIEATYLDYGDKRFVLLSTSPHKLIEELQDLLRLRGFLADQDHITALLAEWDGQPTGILIDTKKKHDAVLQ